MPTELKVCAKCHLELPIDRFTVTNKAKGWRRGACKTCDSARVRAYYASNEAYRTKQNAASAARSKANPPSAEYARRAMLKHKYNLTPEQFDQLLAAQGGCCALCKAKTHGVNGGGGRHSGTHKWLETSWRVDHCHTNGHVRGLLCHTCNTRLGAYEALIAEVGEASVLEYLTRSSPILSLPVVLAPDLSPAPAPRFVAELPPRYTRGQCTVCGADQHAGGLCFKHYMRARRTGGVELTGAVRGAAHHKVSLTEDQARAIKASAERGADLARRYGVTPSVISSIRKGHTWKHLTVENLQ